MSAKTGWHAALVVVAVISSVSLGQSSPSGAQSAAGQLTKIGGQGPTGQPPCDPDLDELTKELKSHTEPTPTDIGGNGFRYSTGMQGIAVDVTGQHLFLAAGGRIVDRAGVVAGRAPVESGGTDPVGPEPDPVDGSAASFPRLAGIAVDPHATTLWTIQGPADLDAENQGIVRKVDLTSPTHPVSTVMETKARPTAIAADGVGNVYVADVNGAIRQINPSGGSDKLGTVTSPLGVAVDVTGSQVFVSSGDGNVYRLGGTSSPEIVAGSSIPHADGGSAALNKPIGLAVGYEIDGSGLLTRYLYIADSLNRRVVRVDFQTTPPTLTTVAGGGSAFVGTTGPATSALIEPQHVAADDAGHLYIDSPNQCAVFQLDVPAPFAQNSPANQPTIPGTTVKPADPDATGSPKDVSSAQQAGTSTQTATNPSGAGQANQTQIVSNTQTPAGDPGSAGNATQVLQPAPQAAPGPPANVATAAPLPTPSPVAAPGAQAPVPAPVPVPVPAPAAVQPPVPVQAPAPVQPPAPAPPPAAAPAPVAGSAPPPPAAPHPVGNVGLADGADPAVATKGAPRYAMVRADDADATGAATLVVAGGGLALALFVCVLFIAPDPQSKPTPRPRGAY